MDKTKPNIVESLSNVAPNNIVSIPTPKSHTIESFNPSKLKDTKGLRYTEVSKTFTTVTEQKNSRFAVSDLVRGALSMNADEEERIEMEVQRRVDERLAALAENTKNEAYNVGYAQGQMTAHEAIVRKSDPLIDRLQALATNFEGMKFDLSKANEDVLIRMVYRLARMVCLKEIKEDPTYTKRLITQLLERLGTRENIKIFVGSEAFSAAETLRAGLAESLGTLKNISIELDPEIRDAGCRVETDFAEVDARIEVQLQNIAETLEVGN